MSEGTVGLFAVQDGGDGEGLEHALSQRSAGAAIGIEQDAQAACADARRLHELQDAVSVPFPRFTTLTELPQLLVADAGEADRVEALLDVVALARREHRVVAAKELEA